MGKIGSAAADMAMVMSRTKEDETERGKAKLDQMSGLLLSYSSTQTGGESN